jgi:ABC-type multidrug transport system ATPase subunit
MIEAFHLRAAARGVTLFEDLTLVFDEGEAWIVSGPPSCGKTMLLRILSGDRRPESGDVVAEGESLYQGDLAAKNRFRLMTAFVPESLPATGQTAGDLFRLSALSAGDISRSERILREEELLALLGVAGTGSVPLSRLSVSERARIALAAELLRGPKILFLDMLLSNAGRDWTDSLLGLFRALAREGRTIVMMERELPERWRGAAEPGAAVASDPRIRDARPFRMFRLAGGSAPAGRPSAGTLSMESSGEEPPRDDSAEEGGEPQ